MIKFKLKYVKFKLKYVKFKLKYVKFNLKYVKFKLKLVNIKLKCVKFKFKICKFQIKNIQFHIKNINSRQYLLGVARTSYMNNQPINQYGRYAFSGSEQTKKCVAVILIVIKFSMLWYFMILNCIKFHKNAT